MTQEIITYIIVAFVFGIIAYKLFNLFTGRRPVDKCAKCNGCALKNELKDKQQNCTDYEPFDKHKLKK